MISRGIFDEAARKKSNYMLPDVDKSLHQEVKYEALFVANPLVSIPWLSIIIGFYNVVHAFGTFWYVSHLPLAQKTNPPKVPCMCLLSWPQS